MIAALMFVTGLALLYVGGEALVRGSAALGIRYGLTPLVVGLTIVGAATSAPELAVSLDAALHDEPGLALGNVVGSNLCNLTLVIGIVVLLCPAGLRDKLERGEVAVMMISTILVPALLTDGRLERVEGVCLVLGIIGYITLTVWRSKTRTSGNDSASDAYSVPVLSERLSINFLLAGVGLGLLLLGSNSLVDACVAMATLLGVTPAVVGLSAAALGTSLPELAASIVAARHGHPEMAAGNLLGSNIFNLLMILGATATVRPLSMGRVEQTDISIMIIASLFCLALLLARKRMGRVDGVLLIGVYVAYMVWLFASGREP